MDIPPFRKMKKAIMLQFYIICHKSLSKMKKVSQGGNLFF